MGKIVTFLLIVLAFLAGLYGGYWYEKNKWVAMDVQQVGDYQKQISDLKMQMQVSPTAAMMEDTIIAMKPDSKGVQYITDTKGMTLYIYDKDTKGVSNCYGACATAWPPYLESKDAMAQTMPANITTIKRTDGSMQYAYNSMPLYYYKSDVKPGDVTGDGVGGVWHLAK